MEASWTTQKEQRRSKQNYCQDHMQGTKPLWQYNIHSELSLCVFTTLFRVIDQNVILGLTTNVGIAMVTKVLRATGVMYCEAVKMPAFRYYSY